MKLAWVLAAVPCFVVANGFWSMMAEAQNDKTVTYQVTVHSGTQVATLPVMTKPQLRACLANEGFNGLRGDAAVQAALADALQRNIDHRVFSIPALQKRKLTFARGQDKLPFDPLARCVLVTVEDWVISAC